MCTEGEVLKAAMSKDLLPSGEEIHKIKRISDSLPEIVYCKFTDSFSPSLLESLVRAKRQYAIAKRLLDNDNCMAMSDLLSDKNDKSALKTLIDKNLIEIFRQMPVATEIAAMPQLSESQIAAIEKLESTPENKNCSLLYGVSGSGKTEIYINQIHKCLSQNQDVLYLIPEIAMSVQLISRLEKIFGNRLIVWHSYLTKTTKRQNYARMSLLNRESLVVLGTRSALFLPYVNLGLVIVDEEHDSSYKQTEPAPRFHARDTAIVLAHQNSARVILGSATPSIESFYNATSGKYNLIELTERFGQSVLPRVILSDIRVATQRGERNSGFNKIVTDQIAETLSRNAQILLFQNRRGYSSYVVCKNCNKVQQCPHCNVSLTLHSNQLVCHYCGYSVPFQDRCAECNGELQTKGFGTERIEVELEKIFPQARIVRIDSDSVRNINDYIAKINSVTRAEADVIIGTQIISKGLDFNNVETVVIMNADSLFYNPDFRSTERAFQMIRQVGGRAGRRYNQGTVIIQTVNPDNTSVLRAASGDYYAMFCDECKHRQVFVYPPFCRLIRLTLNHSDSEVLNNAVQQVQNDLKELFKDRVLGPEYPIVDKIRDRHNVMFLIKTHLGKDGLIQRANLKNIMCGWERLKVRIIVDVDPV
jgi:primosomal protein N' (replication factor Y)